MERFSIFWPRGFQATDGPSRSRKPLDLRHGLTLYGESEGTSTIMSRVLSVVGVPSGAGACGVGQEQSPMALREAGLLSELADIGFEVTDLGDGPTVPWRPDRVRPDAQNLDAVVDVVEKTASRVAAVLSERDGMALVLGGDCTVGIGTVAGVRHARGRIGLIYFDLHSDLNIPGTASDGALDWMALGHMLALDGAEPKLAGACGQEPLIEPDQVMLFGHSMHQSTRFERGEIDRLQLGRISSEDVQRAPEEAAGKALEFATRHRHYVIHLDVDVVDFTDAPLSEHPSRNVGLRLTEMLRALAVLASNDRLAAITVAELNPHNAASDPGLLERFAASLADAIRP